MKKIILFFIAAVMACAMVCGVTGCFEEAETATTEIGGEEDVEVLTEEQWKNAFAQTKEAMGKQYVKKGDVVVGSTSYTGLEKFDYVNGLIMYSANEKFENVSTSSVEGYCEIAGNTIISYINQSYYHDMADNQGWQIGKNEFESHEAAVEMFKRGKFVRYQCDVMWQIFGTNIDNATYLSELFSKFTYNETDKSYSASLDLIYGHGAEADIKITFKYGKIFKSEVVIYSAYDDANGNKVRNFYGTENSEFSYGALDIIIPPEAKNGTEVSN